MIVYVIYFPKERYWGFYTYDSEGYREIKEGFKDHIRAELKAKELFGEDIKFKYN